MGRFYRPSFIYRPGCTKRLQGGGAAGVAPLDATSLPVVLYLVGRACMRARAPSAVLVQVLLCSAGAGADAAVLAPFKQTWSRVTGKLVAGNRRPDVLRDISDDAHEQFFETVAKDCEALRLSPSEKTRFADFMEAVKSSRAEPVWQPIFETGQSMLSQNYFPGLSAKPAWDHVPGDKSLAWLRKLETCTPAIAAELRAVCEAELPAGYAIRDSADFANSLSLDDMPGLTPTERALYVPGFDDRPANGYIQCVLVANEEAQRVSELFPQTMAALEACGVRAGVRLIAFGKQLPHTALHWHSDGRNFMLTAHLPLAGPSECTGGATPPFGGQNAVFPPVEKRDGAAGMVMAPLSFGEASMEELAVPRAWRAGQGVVFDTSFLHSAFNDGDEAADLLFVDFFHPEVTDGEAKAIQCHLRRLREAGEAASAGSGRRAGRGGKSRARQLWDRLRRTG